MQLPVPVAIAQFVEEQNPFLPLDAPPFGSSRRMTDVSQPFKKVQKKKKKIDLNQDKHETNFQNKAWGDSSWI